MPVPSIYSPVCLESVTQYLIRIFASFDCLSHIISSLNLKSQNSGNFSKYFELLLLPKQNRFWFTSHHSLVNHLCQPHAEGTVLISVP